MELSTHSDSIDLLLYAINSRGIFRFILSLNFCDFRFYLSILNLNGQLIDLLTPFVQSLKVQAELSGFEEDCANDYSNFTEFFSAS